MKKESKEIDAVLSKTETREEMERKILNLLEIKDYFSATGKEKRLIKKLKSFILERDMWLIKLISDGRKDENKNFVSTIRNSRH